jgi:hypothetical protein
MLYMEWGTGISPQSFDVIEARLLHNCLVRYNYEAEALTSTDWGDYLEQPLIRCVRRLTSRLDFNDLL